MKNFLHILIVIFLINGCNNKSTKNDTSEEEINNKMIYNVYKSDSVIIDVENNDFNFFILLTIGDFKHKYDLTKLNIPTKTPDDIQWANNEYACMMVWWSQSLSRHIFIPTKRTNELIYLDKDIEETDSINNNVVYVDTVFDSYDTVIFTVENLLTRKTKSLTILINEQNWVYPFYDEILLTRNKLTIIAGNEKKTIDITEIYNDL